MRRYGALQARNDYDFGTEWRRFRYSPVNELTQDKMRKKISELLAGDRILILDGATGTMIQRLGLDEEDFHSGPLSDIPGELRGNNECLNLTRPDLIRDIHRAYIRAGADIIESNTFSANRISQEEYGCAEFAFRMAFEGAAIAREAADEAMSSGDRTVLVAGSIGPTSRSLSLSPDMNDPAFRPVSFDEMALAYSEQMRGLMLGGADLLLIETCFDALNVKAALYALSGLLEDPEIRSDAGIRERLSDGGHFPVIISVSVSDRSGRTLTGQTIEAFYASVRHYPLSAFGLNCSLGAEEIHPLLKEVAGFAECAVSCYPNAGLPDGMGGYAETPHEMAAAVRKMAEDGLLNIAGGCCGTTPEYISAIAEAVRDCPARKRPENGAVRPLTVSGLEAVRIDLKNNNFTNIGERTNVAGSRKFARLIAAGQTGEALQIAAEQIENGASVIDINMDDAMLDSTAEMTRFVRSLSNDPAVAKAALMIDSSHWETILAGLKNAQGKSIVNSISLKEGEEELVRKAREIHALGAAMVVMAFDEQGQATTFARKTEICGRAYRILTSEAGIPPEDIIFDVNVLAIGTGIEEHALYAVDFIKAVGWIKENLPGALTSGGVSNLSFSFRGNNPVREAMHSAFLYHAIQAGLDMAIVNPGMLQIYDEIEPDLLRRVEDVIFNTDPGATERLIEKAQEIAEEDARSKAAAQQQAGSTAGLPCGTAAGPDGPHPAGAANGTEADGSTGQHAANRIISALVKGKSTTLAADLQECLDEGTKPVDIIEGPLMDGMKKVGKLFGSGKMFLPQVVKSAKIMKEAVDFLQPHMEAQPDENAPGRPKIVIATVKGDVHDIGKNITAIVLGCNGFDVIDLGVMVDRETIIGTALREKADIIAASGLITPSLHQMEELCRAMAERGMDTPLFIGGATTSALHTAVKLAPLYDHVFYGADASASAVMAKRYMMDRDSFEAEEHARQAKLRELHRNGRRADSKAESAADGGAAAEIAGLSSAIFPPENYLRHEIFVKNARGFIKETIEDAGKTCEMDIRSVLPHFDWRMFYAIWGIRYGQAAPDAPEMADLRREAEEILARMTETGSCRMAMSVRWFKAYAKDGGIHLAGSRETETPSSMEVTFPMLRQEKPTVLKDGRKAMLSLCDFVPPAGYGFTSPAGIFAISVSSRRDHGRGCGCPECIAAGGYEDMLERSVMNTLAEAASAWLDEQIITTLEAAGPDRYKVIKPAAGYSSCPDHTLKRDVLRLLPDSDKLGITLTESCGMIPDASICGMIFIHKDAVYPEIRSISRSQYDSYASRRGMSTEEARRFLGHLLD